MRANINYRIAGNFHGGEIFAMFAVDVVPRICQNLAHSFIAYGHYYARARIRKILNFPLCSI